MRCRLCCRYCSRAAQKADWAAGHKYECKALQKTGGHTPATMIRLAARALWRWQKEMKEEDVPFWDSFAAIECLVDHTGNGKGEAEEKQTMAHVAISHSTKYAYAKAVTHCRSDHSMRRNRSHQPGTATHLPGPHHLKYPHPRMRQCKPPLHAPWDGNLQSALPPNRGACHFRLRSR
jgi:hypothetical protein